MSMVLSRTREINKYRVLVGNPRGKWPLLRPRNKWDDNIKTDLTEIGLNGTGWIHLTYTHTHFTHHH
jgi:hypothetical protein